MHTLNLRIIELSIILQQITAFLDKIDQEFQAVHYIVKESLAPLERFIGSKVPENESIFITLFIGGHLIESTEKLQTRLKAVVVCPNGLSISRLMEKNITKPFSGNIFLSSDVDSRI